MPVSHTLVHEYDVLDCLSHSLWRPSTRAAELSAPPRTFLSDATRRLMNSPLFKDGTCCNLMNGSPVARGLQLLSTGVVSRLKSLRVQIAARLPACGGVLGRDLDPEEGPLGSGPRYPHNLSRSLVLTLSGPLFTRPSSDRDFKGTIHSRRGGGSNQMP